MKPKLNKLNIIWLASYPRSGNTLLRTVLWHCFGLRSASLYPEDLGGNKELKRYIGHIDQSELEFVGPDLKIRSPGNSTLLAFRAVHHALAHGLQIRFPGNSIPLFKNTQTVLFSTKVNCSVCIN